MMTGVTGGWMGKGARGRTYLDEGVPGPAIDGQVAVTAGAERARVFDGPVVQVVRSDVISLHKCVELTWHCLGSSLYQQQSYRR
jgi:hypothetical protein